MRKTLLSLAVLFAGCAAPDATCGEGTDPVVVTGINGLLGGTKPAVEIELRAPDTCDVLDRTWMFWDESADVATLGDPPNDGMLIGQNIMASEDTIFFHDAGIGLRLEYPEAVVGPAVTFTWFAAGTDLSSVDCEGASGALVCAVRAP